MPKSKSSIKPLEGEMVTVQETGLNQFTDIVMEDLDRAKIDDDEVVEPPPPMEYETVIDKLCDDLIKEVRASKEPYTGIPEMKIITECP